MSVHAGVKKGHAKLTRSLTRKKSKSNRARYFRKVRRLTGPRIEFVTRMDAVSSAFTSRHDGLGPTRSIVAEWVNVMSLGCCAASVLHCHRCAVPRVAPCGSFVSVGSVVVW